MNKKTGIIIGVLALLLIITGVVVYKSVFSTKPAAEVTEDITPAALPPVDASITVDVTRSKVKDNTIVLSVSGLGSKYTFISYELSYETQGVIQGVTSKPLDVTGKDSFVRDDIYLGTCSRNVCRPHVGVQKVTVNLAFTDTAGKQSQFSKDYEL